MCNSDPLTPEQAQEFVCVACRQRKESIRTDTRGTRTPFDRLNQARPLTTNKEIMVVLIKPEEQTVLRVEEIMLPSPTG